MKFSEQRNSVLWNEERKTGHIESFFVKANDPASPRAFWIRYTVLVKPGGQTKCNVWAVAFRDHGAVAAKSQYSVKEVRHRTQPFLIKTSNFEMEDQRLRGEVHGAGHSFRFDLSHQGHSLPLKLLPFEWMYTASFPKFKSHTPFPNEKLFGWFEVDGDRWVVENWPCMQGHNWGVSLAERYAWAHCSNFQENPESYFEGFSAQLKLRNKTTPFLTVLALHHEGQLYRTSLKSLLTKVNVEHTKWTFQGSGKRFQLSGEVSVPADRMVGLVYDNPDGGSMNCLNSKLASCLVRLERKGEPFVELFSPYSSALEVLVRENPSPIQLVI